MTKIYWLSVLKNSTKKWGPSSHLKRCSPLLLLLFCSAFISSSFAEPALNITASVPTSFPPYYQLGENGKIEGFAIDIMDEVARRANINIVYKREESWANIFRASREGKVELIPNIGATEERSTYLDFTQPVHTFKIVLFVRKDRAYIKNIHDLSAKKVGAVITNIGYKLITKNDAIEAIPYDSFEQAIFALLSGQIDALAYPASVAWRMLTKTGYERAVVAVGEPLAEVERVIAVRKGNRALLAQLNKAIGELKRSNEYQAIHHKWFDDAPPFLTVERLLWTLLGLILSLAIAIGTWRHHLLKRYKKEIEKTVALRTLQLSEKIEEQSRTATALKNRERLLSFHFEHTPLAAITWDSHFHCLQWNSAAEKIFGYSKEEAIGKHAFDLIIPCRLYTEADNLFHALISETGGTHSINENITKDRQVLLCEWFNTIIRDDTGTPTSIASLCQDITQQKQAESALQFAKEQAEASNRAKSTFLANISHELRTPLHGILSFSELGMRKTGSAPDEKIRRYFSNIHCSGKRLHLQVNDLLDLSKLEAGKMQLDVTRNDIKSLIKNCAAEQEACFQERNLTIEYQFEPQLPPLECDKNRIEQVILNILSNAIKFSPEGGKITLSGIEREFTTPSGLDLNGIQVSISDQGPGIPKGEEEIIFQKFMQSSSNKYSSGGTGLGLAISQKIMQAHCGSIWSEESSPEGACFSFLLPINFIKEADRC
ncbi:MAG: transporter substrate-binding domain-containing protein [Candidatus Polarisedimenticolaceae bacterium]|nr:transporter substrate-binding domain-containing protein [Candidatus Polarisedimenticolaceae bacterium]